MSPDRVCCQNYYHDSIAVKQHGVMSMPVVTVRNLPEETHRALKVRAAEHGRSTEAEIREILEEAVRPATRIKMGRSLPPSESVLAVWISTLAETRRRSSRRPSNDRTRYERGVGADEGARQSRGVRVARSSGCRHAVLHGDEPFGIAGRH